MSPIPAPLSNAAFRAVWLASVFSFIGTWVQDVGESWAMLSMSRDPRLVALLTTSFLAPTLALTLPAGLLADRVDRRRLLLWSQAACAFDAAAPAVAIRAHAMTPFVLLACTAMLGAAVSIGAPAWITHASPNAPPSPLAPSSPLAPPRSPRAPSPQHTSPTPKRPPAPRPTRGRPAPEVNWTLANT